MPPPGTSTYSVGRFDGYDVGSNVGETMGSIVVGDLYRGRAGLSGHKRLLYHHEEKTTNDCDFMMVVVIRRCTRRSNKEEEDGSRTQVTWA